MDKNKKIKISIEKIKERSKNSFGVKIVQSFILNVFNLNFIS